MKRILITKYEEKLFCGLFEDRKLQEVLLEEKDNPSLLGNIYIGKVSRIVSNINAAFVDIGIGEDCYYPLDGAVHLFCSSKASKKFSVGDEIIVQVSQEGQKRKHPTLTSAIEFKSKNLILTLGKKGVGLSSKIPAERKKKIRQQLEEVLGGLSLTEEKIQAGLLVRSSGVELTDSELREEAKKLLEESRRKLELWSHRKAFSCLFAQEEEYLSYLYGLSHGSYEEILTDLPEVKEKLEEKGLPLRFYQEEGWPLIKLYSIREQIEAALSARVWLKSGAYLVIQVTEALTVIDVNTGKNTGKKEKKELLRRVNLEAAKEAARQIRLRNLSGIILIDFIDLHEKEIEEELLNCMKEYVREDPNKVQVYDFTRLRLMELTRKKIRKPLWEQVKNSGKSS